MQTLKLERTNGIAQITLNRPTVRNAINERLIDEVTQALKEVATDGDVRVLVVTGAGSAFCGGADLEWMERAAGLSEVENFQDAERLANMLSCLYRMPIPVIAKVNGPAVAGGMGLVCACDVVVAARKAHFALSEVRIGLVPATIAPYVVRAIGLQACRRYMLTAERISAEEAAQIGLVHKLCDDAELDTVVDELASLLRAGAPNAVQQTKRLLSWVDDWELGEATTVRTAKLIAQIRSSPEGREGLRAFLEKRLPEWQAR